MGKIVELLIPEGEDEVDVIEQYFDFILEKHECYCPEYDPDQVEYWKQRALKSQLEGEVLIIYESVSHRHRFVLDWKAIYETLDENDKIADPEGALCLASLLREGKDRLMRGEGPNWEDGLDYTAEEFECELETGNIALCEFAGKNGYSVRLSE